jgi:hypothetical protein
MLRAIRVFHPFAVFFSELVIACRDVDVSFWGRCVRRGGPNIATAEVGDEWDMIRSIMN